MSITVREIEDGYEIECHACSTTWTTDADAIGASVEALEHQAEEA